MTQIYLSYSKDCITYRGMHRSVKNNKTVNAYNVVIKIKNTFSPFVIEKRNFVL